MSPVSERHKRSSFAFVFASHKRPSKYSMWSAVLNRLSTSSAAQSPAEAAHLIGPLTPLVRTMVPPALTHSNVLSVPAVIVTPLAGIRSVQVPLIFSYSTVPATTKALAELAENCA